ncbi:prepilin peptidase [Providencia sneebia]|uniref:Prepilin peptidase n=1 Tax=Providencia sneebia DSM 19967 TaxID=1141660 RepID=K8WT96_9GAMM|nr:A24 family peptidase [Providencia sneebia]EKT59390.1 prepilin peptidase [Providencia sneebia DSM 19967]
MNTIELLINEIMIDLFYFPFDFFEKMMSLICSAQEPNQECCFLNRINKLGVFDFITHRCVYEISLIFILAIFIAKINQNILRYIPEKYFDKKGFYIKYKWFLLLYLLVVFVFLILKLQLINILFLMVFINCIVSLFIIDIKIGYLPDVLTYPLLWCGLIYQTCSSEGNVVSAIYAVVISYLFIMVITTITEQVRQRPQMGRGDFKLIAACSAWLGLIKLPLFLAVAASLGGIHYAIAYLISRKKTIDYIPFGPAIIVSSAYWLFAPLIYKFIFL